MPQELSEMRRNIYIFKGRLKELVSKIDKNDYEKFINALQSISEVTEKYYTPDDKWNYPPVAEQDMAEIQQQYKHLLDVCLEVGAKQEKPKDWEAYDTFYKLIEDVGALAIKDLSALQVVRVDGKATLPEIIYNARAYTVDMGECEEELPKNLYEIDKRFPMQINNNNSKVNGYFMVSGSNEIGNKHWGAVIDEMLKEYPDYTDVLEIFRKIDMRLLDPNNPSKFVYYTEATAMSPNGLDGKQEPIYDQIARQMEDEVNNSDIGANYREGAIKLKIRRGLTQYHYTKELEQLNIPKERINELTDNDEFISLMNRLGSELESFINEKAKYDNPKQILGIQQDADVDKRNIAMHSVASMLGKSELVPEARSLIVVKDDRNVAGTFVEVPSGISPLKVDKYDPIVQYNLSNYDNPAVFDDISALQALDYICGNVNRHDGSYLMNFDDDGKLVSIKGIENQFSFGTKVPNEDEGIEEVNWVKPKQMGVIGEKVANAITLLTKEALELGLRGYGLSQEQIDAAWERTVIMQKVIENGLNHYKNVEDGKLDRGYLRVVPNDQWNKYHISQIADMGDNRFKTFSNMVNLLKDPNSKTINELLNKMTGTDIDIEDISSSNHIVEVNTIGNGLEKIGDIGIKLTDTVKLVVEEDGPLPTVAGTKTVRYGVTFEQNGTLQTGFFTPLSEVNKKWEFHRIMDEVAAMYPKYENEIERMRQYFLADSSIQSHILYPPAEGTPFEELDYTEEEANNLRASKELKEAIGEISRRISMSEKNLKDYRAFGVDENASIDQRNVAMSNIATLCGAPDLLAKSYNVQMQVGNRIVDGVFMETAKGVDVFRLKKDDAFLSYGDEVFDSGPGLKSLAELQIIDYLCMNMDRHEGNMLYQFSEGPNPKLVGVIGIDNDYSFGNKDPDGDVAYMVTSVENIRVISERMAKNIMSITPEHFGQTMKEQKVGNNEITAAQERLGRLQARIKLNKIEVIKDAEWNDYTLDQLAGHDGSNIFSRVKNHTKALRDEAKQARDKKEKFKNDDLKPIEYKKVKIVDKLDESLVMKHDTKKSDAEKAAERIRLELEAKRKAMEDEIKNSDEEFKEAVTVQAKSFNGIYVQNNAELFEESSKIIKNVNELIADADPSLIRSSKQFRQMKNKAKELNEFVKTIENRDNRSGNPTDNEMDNLVRGLEELNAKVTEYVNYKVGTVKRHEERFNSLEQKRVLAARTTGSLAKGFSAIYAHNQEMYKYTYDSEKVVEEHIKDTVSDILRLDPNAQKEEFANAVAQKLYYSVIKISINNHQLNKYERQAALIEENVQKGAKQIKETEAFKNLMEKKADKMKLMVTQTFDDEIYDAYIKEMANISIKSKAPVNKNNNAIVQEPKNQLNQPNQLQ